MFLLYWISVAVQAVLSLQQEGSTLQLYVRFSLWWLLLLLSLGSRVCGLQWLWLEGSVFAVPEL